MPSHSELKALFESFDVDHNRTVSYSELVAALEKDHAERAPGGGAHLTECAAPMVKGRGGVGHRGLEPIRSEALQNG